MAIGIWQCSQKGSLGLISFESLDSFSQIALKFVFVFYHIFIIYENQLIQDPILLL